MCVLVGFLLGVGMIVQRFITLVDVNNMGVNVAMLMGMHQITMRVPVSVDMDMLMSMLQLDGVPAPPAQWQCPAAAKVFL